MAQFHRAALLVVAVVAAVEGSAPPTPPPPPPVCNQPDLDSESVDQLKAMMKSLSGWKRNDNWGNGDPCVDGWYGLVCACPDGIKNELVGMQLNANGMTGVLPADLFTTFTYITKIDLSGNKITGPLPDINGVNNPNLGYLYLSQDGTTLTGTVTGPLSVKALQEFDARGNAGLTGTIPATIGTDAPYISLLILAGTGVSGEVPSSLWDLRNMAHLDLSGLGLTGQITSGVSQMAAVTILNLNQNAMSGPIPEFHTDSFTGENSVIYVVGNKFENLPTQFYGTGVTELQASNNALSGVIPAAVGNASNLAHLFLNGNNLGGTIPPELCKCKGLKIIDLSANQLQGVPECFGEGMSQVTDVLLYNNNLQGTLPMTSMCQIASLTQIQLQNNPSLGGSIADCVSNWNNLVTFIIDRTSMSGTIPTGLFTSSKLQTLIVSQSRFEGTIPDKFDATPALITVTIQSSHVGNTVVEPYITGPIPKTLFGLKDLQSLTLQFNRLSGTIPDMFGGVAKLNQILLNNNLLSGTFPGSVVELMGTQPQDATPRIVMMSYNYLTGTLPSPVNVVQVEKLVFNYNPFGGYIPTVYNTTHSWLNNSGGDSSDRYRTFFAGMDLLPPIPTKYQTEMGASPAPFSMAGSVTVSGEDKNIVNIKQQEEIKIQTSNTRDLPDIFAAICQKDQSTDCTDSDWEVFPVEHPIYQDPWNSGYLSTVNFTIPEDTMTLGDAYLRVMFKGDDYSNRGTVVNFITGQSSLPHIIIYEPNPEVNEATPLEGRKWGCTSIDVTGGPFINTGSDYLKCKFTPQSDPLAEAFFTPVTYHNESWITCNIPEKAEGHPLGQYLIQVTPNNGSTYSVSPNGDLFYEVADDCPVSPSIPSLPKGQNCSCGMCECTSAGLCFYNGTAKGMQCECDKGFEGADCEECQYDHYGIDCKPCRSCNYPNGHCSMGKNGTGSCKCDMWYSGPGCGWHYKKFFIIAVSSGTAAIILIIIAYQLWKRVFSRFPGKSGGGGLQSSAAGYQAVPSADYGTCTAPPPIVEGVKAEAPVAGQAPATAEYECEGEVCE
eukprot:TRINITY_DN3719_c0_g2_i1.p1 TRINITY_DN3719_c0_g2~~TRINITY_DN3719_c0_g2_i1.p1  ORF type:complete len:1067 (+),score=167.14 TRINITY_DN3719_c0_g2_i1:37-3201(+)